MFNWPGNDYRDAEHPRPAAARRGAARCRMPSASASASSTGCRRRRRGRAPARASPSSSRGPTSWAPPTASPSIPTSANAAASGPCRTIRRAGRRRPRSSAGAARRSTSRIRSASAGIRSTSHRPAPTTSAVSLPDPALPDPARRAHPRSRPEPPRRRQEPRHDAHHQWLLPPASRRVEYRRGGRRARRLRARDGPRSRGDTRRPGAAARFPAPSRERGRAALLVH